MALEPVSFDELNTLKGIDITQTIQNQIDNGAGGFQNPAITALDMDTYDVQSSGGNSVWTVDPGNDVTADILAAMTAANTAGGGTVQLKGGVYRITSTIECDGFNNVRIRGIGQSTILDFDPGVQDIMFLLQATQAANANNKAISNVTRGDTSITLTTAAFAASFLAGDLVTIRGTDSISVEDIEVGIAAANGNGSTGEVPLVTPIARTMTSCTASATSGNTNMSFENMLMQHTDSIDGSAAIVNRGGMNNRVVGCSYTLWNDGSAGCIQFGGLNSACSFNMLVDQCYLSENLTTSIAFGQTVGTSITNTRFFNECTSGDTTFGPLRIDGGSRDIFIQNNKWNGSKAMGIRVSNDTARRIYINNGNSFVNVISKNIAANQLEMVICNNSFDGSGDFAVFGSGKRLQVNDNKFFRCNGGISLQQTGDSSYQINDNKIELSGQDGIVSYGDSAVINGNSFNSFSAFGIYTKGNNLSLTGNAFKTWPTGTYAMVLGDATTRSAVVGNTFSGGDNHGFALADTSDYNNIVGNNFGGQVVEQGAAVNNQWTGNIP